MARDPFLYPNSTRRMRWKGLKYSTPGYYFITICQRQRRHLFSRINLVENSLTPAGRMILEVTSQIESRFRHTKVDTNVIMPNHVHLLLGINLQDGDYEPDSAIDVVHWWKTQTTNRYGWSVKSEGWIRYEKSLWQEGYHDRFIRTQRELEYVRYYIEQNPTRWAEDTFYEEEM